MKTEIKARWVEALRSGEYQQARGYLTRVADDGSMSHCCLGVLCELAAAEGVTERSGQRTARPLAGDGLTKFHGYSETMLDGSKAFPSGVLPVEVAAWAGLEGTHEAINPSIGWDYINDVPDVLEVNKRTLASVNDSGRDFSAIADLIEEFL